MIELWLLGNEGYSGILLQAQILFKASDEETFAYLMMNIVGMTLERLGVELIKG